jgi:hypothetical protein
MPRQSIYLAAAAAALLAAPLAAGAQVAPIAKTELRRDPPAVTDRRLKDLLWDMFQRRDRRSKQPPQALLRAVDLRTRPVATSVPNLCRYDDVRLDMAPAMPGPADADTPVRAIGLSSVHMFRFLVPPPLEPRPARDLLPHTGGACGGLDLDKTGRFFSASRPQEALAGMVAFLKLQRALAAKRPLDLACDRLPDEKRDCADILRAVSAEGLNRVESCEGPAQTECLALSFEDVSVRIVLATAESGASDVQSVRLGYYIIVADTLID